VTERRPADLEARIARILPGDPEVRLTGSASVGAQRMTLFADVTTKSRTRAAVAQIADGVLAVADVDVEARLMTAASKAGVVVPEVLAWDAREGVIVTARVAGESIPRRILRLSAANPALGPRLARDCARSLAALHSLPTGEFEMLPNLAAPLDYVDMLRGTLEELPVPHPTFRLGLNWLTREIPSPSEGVHIVHGDFRNGNMLVTDQGLSAVLDWELAHRGDPMEDLAWLCLRTWRFGNDEAEVGGFARLGDLRDAYEEAGGVWRVDAFRWWTVARTLWWGLGLARQAQAFLAAESTSIVLAASGRRVVELEYDLLRLISDAQAG
jgi:aminoglycoside phosphotransferase (APT) family kinase protein